MKTSSERPGAAEVRKQKGWVGVSALLAVLSTATLLAGAFMPSVQAKPAGEAKRIFARAKAEDFKGDDYCLSCHEDKVNNFKGSGHAAFMSGSSLPADHKGCEGCHGAGGVHQDEDNPEVVSFTSLTPKESSAACLRCHGETLSEAHWKKTSHAKADVSCVSCHQIHPESEPVWADGKVKKTDPKAAIFHPTTPPKALLKGDESRVCGQCHNQELGQFRLASHHPMPEGKITCSECHSVHPSKESKSRRLGFKDACVKCHTEAAGPFVHEHDPVAGGTGDGCVECHRPHGSNNPKLLNSYTRGLCAQCHTEKLTGHFPGHTCWEAGCHAAPHGSNTDPLFRRP